MKKPLPRKKGPECLVIAGSAGSFAMLAGLLAAIPAGFELPVLVVIHRSRKYPSQLSGLLQKNCAVEVKEAEDKEIIRKGTVYLAPVDFHLLVEPDGRLSLDASEPVLYCRPAADVTLCSAAEVYRENLWVLVLSGANEDSAAGARCAEQLGGRIFVQDPSAAEVPTMPAAVLKRTIHPYVLNNDEIYLLPEQISAAVRQRL